MKVCLIINSSEHQKFFGAAMRKGLKRQGVEVVRGGSRGEMVQADAYVTWGWRQAKPLRSAGKEVLVMERGYIGDRFNWTSLGWNGLNGRAKFSSPLDNGERFEEHFAQFLKPWFVRKGPALIIGQVPGDASLANVRIEDWYGQAIRECREAGFNSVFRPHPVCVERGNVKSPSNVPVQSVPLDEALRFAGLVVTWNSNTAVDAAMAGVPSVAYDQDGSMAAPIAASKPQVQIPDRSEWFKALAWKQWSVKELESGFAWEVLRDANDAVS